MVRISRGQHLTPNTLTQADVGAGIRVLLSYEDGFGASESVASATTGPVENVNDAPTGTVTISGQATEGQTLTANAGLADDDGLGDFSYQWQRDGIDITGAFSSTYTLTQADVDAEIGVVVSYTDQWGTQESVTSAIPTTPVVNVNDAPTGAVIIRGTVAEGQTLSADTATLADADGLGALSYQWKADGVNISGATEASYTLTASEIGTRITVEVSYTDGESTPETVLARIIHEKAAEVA